MMPPVFPLLAAAPDVTALIGTAPVRCYPAVIPQTSDGQPNNTLLPAVTWLTIVGTPENYIDTPPTIEQSRVQVDAWALTLALAQQVFDAARAALEDGGRNVMASSNGFDYEPETKRFRVSGDFEFWVSR